MESEEHLNKLRKAAATFNGYIFSTREVRPLFNHARLSTLLQELVELGELEYLGIKKTGGNDTKLWKEVKLKPYNPAVCSNLPVWVREFEENAPPWFVITGRHTHYPDDNGT